MQIIFIEEDSPKFLPVSRIEYVEYIDETGLVRILYIDGSMDYLHCWKRQWYDNFMIMIAEGKSVVLADDSEPLQLLEDN